MKIKTRRKTTHANGWTDERRARQAALIRRWKPWTKSTGPKTLEGKARTRLNAQYHGLHGAQGRAFFSLLRLQRRFVMALRKQARWTDLTDSHVMSLCKQQHIFPDIPWLWETYA